MDSHSRRILPKVAFVIVMVPMHDPVCQADLHKEALEAARKATAFLTDQLSTEGGYLWRYSADLAKREGEGIVTTQTVWVQPPGTPTVGEAFVQLYEATGDPHFLHAARSAGEALRRGQMLSGGWQAMIEFEPSRRKKWAYRTDAPRIKAKDQSSLDDDKSQAALRFCMRLDRAFNFQDEAIHEMALYALDGLLTNGQRQNGGFPQVWSSQQDADADPPPLSASYPDAWSRTYLGHREYWYRYTLNDNLAPDVLRTLLLADKIYENARYRNAALKLADFLCAAQMPEPQPAWAQQYSFKMQPIWARKFEPPAVTGGESQGVIETLLSIYRETGDSKYLKPIPRALDYLKRSELPDGRLARFYELKTNRPLYFTKNYVLTYDDSDLPTHYSFKVDSRIDRLRAAYEQAVAGQSPESKRGDSPAVTENHVDTNKVRQVIDDLDERGAWVTDGMLRYHRKAGHVVDMRVAVENLRLLAKYLRASAPDS